MARTTERIRLTLDRIRKLTPPEGGQAAYVFDDDPKQLCVRVTPAGAKSFVFAGKLNKAPMRITIGATSVWNLDDARTESRRLQTLLDQGIDPREQVREQAEAKAAAKAAKEAAAEATRQAAETRQRYTLRALCDAYTASLVKRGKAQSAAAARSILKCHVFDTRPEIAALPAREVTSLQIAAMVRKVHEAGKERAAGILRSYLSAAFNAAKKAPFDPRLPADLIPFDIQHNPVDAIPAIAVKRGDRTLSADELRAYVAALGDDLTDLALRLALLAGGQRMAQLLRAKVGDYDPDTTTLRLWDSKGKRPDAREHLLPLAPKAAALVAGLVERAKSQGATGGTWLFSTHGKVAMIATTPGKRAAEICISMGGEPFDLRDIRRTVETMLAGMGIHKDVRAQLLSHGLSGVQDAHYDRHAYTSEKRAALVAWEARLDAIETGSQTPANVVALHSAA